MSVPSLKSLFRAVPSTGQISSEFTAALKAAVADQGGVSRAEMTEGLQSLDQLEPSRFEGTGWADAARVLLQPVDERGELERLRADKKSNVVRDIFALLTPGSNMNSTWGFNPSLKAAGFEGARGIVNGPTVTNLRRLAAAQGLNSTAVENAARTLTRIRDANVYPDSAQILTLKGPSGNLVASQITFLRRNAEGGIDAFWVRLDERGVPMAARLPPHEE